MEQIAFHSGKMVREGELSRRKKVPQEIGRSVFKKIRRASTVGEQGSTCYVFYPLSKEPISMQHERRRAPRYAFVAIAEARDASGVRTARVKDLSICGAYLAMTNPFSKHASILVEIRTKTEFFQCRAIVAHSTHGLGMGVVFQDMSPPSITVLQQWLRTAMGESRVG